MNTKLTTLDQVVLLNEGDIISRFPYNSTDGPQDRFDEARFRNIITYEIRSINLRNGMFSLIVANFRTIIASPIDVGRLFIKSTDLIKEKVWWVNS